MSEKQWTIDVSKMGRPRDQIIHQRILDVAFHMLRRDGYHLTTVKRIAAESKVSRQTVYRRWPNKSWLFFEVVTDQVFKSPLNTTPSAITLEDFLHGLLKLGRERTAKILSSIFIEAQDDPLLFEKLQELSRTRRQILQQVVEADAERHGCRLTHSSALIAEVLSASLWYRLVLCLEIPDEQHVDDLIHLMRTSYTKRERVPKEESL